MHSQRWCLGHTCKLNVNVSGLSFSTCRGKMSAVTSMLSMHVCRVQPSYPRQTFRHETYQAPTPQKRKKRKKSKIPNRTLWAVAPHSLWLEYEIETQTYRGTCRTRFDDAVEQTLHRDNAARLIVFTMQSARRDVRVVLLVKGHPCKSRISASPAVCVVDYLWLYGFDWSKEAGLLSWVNCCNP